MDHAPPFLNLLTQQIAKSFGIIELKRQGLSPKSFQVKYQTHQISSGGFDSAGNGYLIGQQSQTLTGCFGTLTFNWTLVINYAWLVERATHNDSRKLLNNQPHHPVDDPGYSSNRKSRDKGSGKPLNFKAGNKPVTDHQDNGSNDQVDDCA